MDNSAPAMLAPMRIGEILDRSFRTLKVVFPKVMGLYILVAVIATLQQLPRFMENPLFSVCAAIINIVASIVLYFSVIFLVSEHWQNRELSFEDARKKIALRHILRTIWVSIVISVPIGVAAIFAVMTAGIGLLIVIIPCIIWFMNRILAYYIVLLEDLTAAESMKRSKFLMSRDKWYALSGPWMRVSGLLLVTWILSLTIGLLIGGGTLVGLSYQEGVIALVYPVFFFLMQLLANAVYVFSASAMIGFYYDLRIRYEGMDLTSALDV